MDVIMRYAKSELTELHQELEAAEALHGNSDDGTVAIKEVNVLYQGDKGRLHNVHVTWDEVKDFKI
jgi:hypothetical protein